MNVFELTRALVDIESITGTKSTWACSLSHYLSGLASRHGGRVERMEVEPHRFNVFAQFGERRSSRSPPTWIRCRRSSRRARMTNTSGAARACDTKGIIASMITAAERLLERGGTNLGLLFVVGEERNSAGAFRAAKEPRGSRFMINGEPTENKLALGSKGALRYELVATRQDGALGLSGAGRFGDREAARRAEPRFARSNCRWTPCLGQARSTSAPSPAAARRTSFPMKPAPRCSSAWWAIPPNTQAGPRRSGCRESASKPSEVLEIPALHLGALDGLRDHGGRLHHRYSGVRNRAGASRFCSVRAPFTWRTRSRSACRNSNCSTQCEIYQRMVQDLWKRE